MSPFVSQPATADGHVPDGLSEIARELPLVIEMIARTARWVHPEIFRALPVWCPDTARGLPRYDGKWTKVLSSAKGQQKREENIRAASALVAALGVRPRKPKNWTVCHIWGYDDPKFAVKSNIVQDRRFYSCVGNMVWLPTPLKGFTDSVPEVRSILRHCAFHLYGWMYDGPEVAAEVAAIRSGATPQYYPESWPTADRRIAPPGLAPASERAWHSVQNFRTKIQWCLDDLSFVHYPRDEVREVQRYWKDLLNVQ